MKINWKLRLQNRATLAALAACLVSLIYTIMGIVGVAPPVSEDQVTQWLAMVLNALTLLGVVIDPTTEGIGDSHRAMQYDAPN